MDWNFLKIKPQSQQINKQSAQRKMFTNGSKQIPRSSRILCVLCGETNYQQVVSGLFGGLFYPESPSRTSQKPISLRRSGFFSFYIYGDILSWSILINQTFFFVESLKTLINSDHPNIGSVGLPFEVADILIFTIQY